MKGVGGKEPRHRRKGTMGLSAAEAESWQGGPGRPAEQGGVGQTPTQGQGGRSRCKRGFWGWGGCCHELEWYLIVKLMHFMGFDTFFIKITTFNFMAFVSSLNLIP